MPFRDIIRETIRKLVQDFLHNRLHKLSLLQLATLAASRGMDVSTLPALAAPRVMIIEKEMVADVMSVFDQSLALIRAARTTQRV